MSNVMNPNGRARKTLADQIDRLDRVLDGLAEGLNEAVATEVQRAVGRAVREHDPELFSDPDSWRDRMSRRERAVCRVEYSLADPDGTGFRVGPDLLVKNSKAGTQSITPTTSSSTHRRTQFQPLL